MSYLPFYANCKWDRYTHLSLQTAKLLGCYELSLSKREQDAHGVSGMNMESRDCEKVILLIADAAVNGSSLLELDGSPAHRYTRSTESSDYPGVYLFTRRS